jgi:alcohol dehydrogenase class IV
MMQFEFATSSKIIFGYHSLADVRSIARSIGKRALIVTGKGGANPEQLFGLLQDERITYATYAVSGEPKVEDIREGTILAKARECDFIIGFGGGSALDAGKAISALINNGGDLYDYLEVVGRGKTLTKPAAPMIAIPTTSGTGSEVTRNAVLTAPEQHVKVSLRSPLMIPKIALIDPELTLNLPPEITASTGMDALAQVIEPFVSIRANPIVDGFCREGMRYASWALLRAFYDGSDRTAREAMSLTSLLGGLSLANAGLGAVHGFAAPLGGMFDAPHGAVCAALLPAVMEVNVGALRARQPDSSLLNRYEEIARMLTGDENASIDMGIRWLKNLRSDLEIPGLSTYGVNGENISSIADRAAMASSMKANPIKLTTAEMLEILEKAF